MKHLITLLFAILACHAVARAGDSMRANLSIGMLAGHMVGFTQQSADPQLLPRQKPFVPYLAPEVVISTSGWRFSASFTLYDNALDLRDLGWAGEQYKTDRRQIWTDHSTSALLTATIERLLVCRPRFFISGGLMLGREYITPHRVYYSLAGMHPVEGASSVVFSQNSIYEAINNVGLAARCGFKVSRQTSFNLRLLAFRSTDYQQEIYIRDASAISGRQYSTHSAHYRLLASAGLSVYLFNTNHIPDGPIDYN